MSLIEMKARRRTETNMKTIELELEELEQRIAPDAIGGTPGTGTGNSNGHGTEVSGGERPEPEPSGR
jgi:hypothetical protein